MANRVVGQDVYEWSLASLDGRPVLASSGLDLAPTIPFDKIGKVEILFVCGGINVREAVSAPLLTALRRLAERRVALGALCTGGYALARAGLLDNYRATIHWENLPALREEFPRVQLNNQVFSIDRDRYTCSGGTAPLDLMLNLIQLKHGPRISQLVSEQFVLERVRSDQDRQYVPLRAQVGASHRSMIKVAELMEENIEKPLSLDRIADSHRPCRDARLNGCSAAISTACRRSITSRCGCAGRGSSCSRLPCRSPTSPLPAASSRHLISPAATATSSAILQAPSAGSGNPRRRLRRALRARPRTVRPRPEPPSQFPSSCRFQIAPCRETASPIGFLCLTSCPTGRLERA